MKRTLRRNKNKITRIKNRRRKTKRIRSTNRRYPKKMKGGENNMSENDIRLEYPFIYAVIKKNEFSKYFDEAVLTEQERFEKTFLQEFLHDIFEGNIEFQGLFEYVSTGRFGQTDFYWTLKPKYKTLEDFPLNFRSPSSWPSHFRNLWHTKYYTYKSAETQNSLTRENNRLKQIYENNQRAISKKDEDDKADNERRLRNLTLGMESKPTSLSEADFEILQRVNRFMTHYYDKKTVYNQHDRDETVSYTFNSDPQAAPKQCDINESDIDVLKKKIDVDYNKRPKQWDFMLQPKKYKLAKMKWYDDTIQKLDEKLKEDTSDDKDKVEILTVRKKLRCRQKVLETSTARVFYNGGKCQDK